MAVRTQEEGEGKMKGGNKKACQEKKTWLYVTLYVRVFSSLSNQIIKKRRKMSTEAKISHANKRRVFEPRAFSFNNKCTLAALANTIL